ncbi:carboxypeptidase-like regulatory domain-containing protein [Candidatus Hydrogenedentota bacterium]
MKLRLAVLVIIALCLSGYEGCDVELPDEWYYYDDRTIIEGEVDIPGEYNDGEVAVILYDDDGYAVATDISDSDGYFYLGLLREGVYYLTADVSINNPGHMYYHNYYAETEYFYHDEDNDLWFEIELDYIGYFKSKKAVEENGPERRSSLSTEGTTSARTPEPEG